MARAALAALVALAAWQCRAAAAATVAQVSTSAELRRALETPAVDTIVMTADITLQLADWFAPNGTLMPSYLVTRDVLLTSSSVASGRLPARLPVLDCNYTTQRMRLDTGITFTFGSIAVVRCYPVRRRRPEWARMRNWSTLALGPALGGDRGRV